MRFIANFVSPKALALLEGLVAIVAVNVVQRDAWFHYEFRNLPTVDAISIPHLH